MDQFKRIKKIGKGNYGDVLLVQRKSDDKLFAIKRVDLSFRESYVVDPLNEVKLLRSLDHPNIISHYDSFTHNNKLCIVMEYAENADLSMMTNQAKQTQTYIDENTVQYLIYAILQILGWFSQISIAIQYLHQLKIIHRDIKLQNIFLCTNGIVKLGDFGISRTLDNTLDLAQTSIGTPFYLSPEICQNQQYNHKIDIWMLGCTLYELCTLQKPFKGESISEIAFKIINEPHPKIQRNYSDFISQLIDEMLEKNPEKRPDISTIIQYPQIQSELYKLQGLYKTQFNYILPVSPMQSNKSSQKKMHKNSIHFLVEQSKQLQQQQQQQQQQSPQVCKQKRRKVSLQQLIQDTSNQNSPTFKQLATADNANKNKPLSFNLHTLPDVINESIQQNSAVMAQRQLRYQKSISINTQIDDATKRGTNEYENENQPTLLKNPKTFSFAGQFLNPNAPTSPQRSILLTDFLKRKIGEEKFQQMKTLLESSNNPIKMLDQEKELVSEILGEENMECIKIFKVLISSSITPQAQHTRTKSSQSFQQYNHNDQSLIDLIKESDLMQNAEHSQNSVFEISFKNLQNCHDAFKQS
ncbi:unnamed protein product [Paramecium primaurelia]|uniref:non-specific serine/threonine protein kinase n=1 Tax=Paramecium primaurelia TaxID=5886 RepID=A0A8S1LJR8_PARPR|nr:unnamed protein product [Paramecium primaurelia]